MKKLALIFCFLFCDVLKAQYYPRWFLFPGDVQCQPAITIITQPPTFYRDSAIAEGFRMGCDLQARYAMMQISGGQAFWATEAGVHSMGAHYEVRYDTTMADFYRRRLTIRNAYVDKQKTLVFISDSNCLLDDKSLAKVRLDQIKQPGWVERLPDDGRYHYAVGASEEFYYETSSWQTAEKNASMALARSLHVTMQSLQKSTVIETQDIRNEEINVTLLNVEVVERWKDEKKKVYYVLIRMKK
jgi:hypothetical protein